VKVFHKERELTVMLLLDLSGSHLFGTRQRFKRASHVWRLFKVIFTYEPQDLTTNVDAVLTCLNRVAKRHAIVFLISDCMDAGFDKSLRMTAKNMT